jgi:hypothetical protein
MYKNLYFLKYKQMISNNVRQIPEFYFTTSVTELISMVRGIVIS